MLFPCLFSPAKNECRHQGKEGCHHFCYPGTDSYRCSCADGYELGKDKKQCIALGRCEHGGRAHTAHLGTPAIRILTFQTGHKKEEPREQQQRHLSSGKRRNILSEHLQMGLQRASFYISLTGAGFPLLLSVKSNRRPACLGTRFNWFRLGTEQPYK